MGKENYICYGNKDYYKKFKYEDIDFATIKKKNVSIFLKEEEIYTFKMKLPKMNNLLLRENIEREINLLFKKEDILFDYSVISCNKNILELIVKCINTDRYELLDNYFAHCKKLNIIPLQEALIREIKSKTNIKHGIIVAHIDGILYSIVLKEGDLVFSTLNKDIDKDNGYSACTEALELITKALVDWDISLPKTIYTININLGEENIKSFNIENYNINSKELFNVK
ncbi:hypothetical protein KQI89_03240 [Clostridium sp. MSJ-4]|uniref:Uncharacterized protein n=1 Tax=Clostridium simiarum TaxID=2841506 RepID=A0ABS6EZH7_9CLOT|nr:hypothetical protein [Clostridium simiarum]MBU5590767.1 hypothetical protein [Clostridium simiarum]